MVTHISPKKSNTIKPNCVAQACVQDGGSAGEESICWSLGAAPRGSMSPIHLMCPGGVLLIRATSPGTAPLLGCSSGSLKSPRLPNQSHPLNFHLISIEKSSPRDCFSAQLYVTRALHRSQCPALGTAERQRGT